MNATRAARHQEWVDGGIYELTADFVLRTRSGKPSTQPCNWLRRGDRFRADVVVNFVAFMPTDRDSAGVVLPLSPGCEEFVALLKPAPANDQTLIETKLERRKPLSKKEPGPESTAAAREQPEPFRARTVSELKAELEELKAENEALKSSGAQLEISAEGQQPEPHRQEEPSPRVRAEESSLHRLAKEYAVRAYEEEIDFRRGVLPVHSISGSSLLCLFNNDPPTDGSTRRERETEAIRNWLKDRGIKELAYASHPEEGHPDAGYSYAMLIDAPAERKEEILIEVESILRIGKGEDVFGIATYPLPPKLLN